MKLFNYIVLAIFVGTMLFTAVQFQNLPTEVPSHYGITGEPDSWANKWFIFFMPLLGLMLWVIMGKIGYSSTFINMPNGGKPLNEAQIQNSLQLIHVLRNEILLFMSLFTIKEVLVLTGSTIDFGIWEFVVFIGVVAVTLVWFIAKNNRLKTDVSR